MLIITNIATNSIILKFKMQGWSDIQFSFETNGHKSLSRSRCYVKIDLRF